jgi:hypothetical protein
MTRTAPAFFSQSRDALSRKNADEVIDKSTSFR